MPVFEYTARDSDGKKIVGIIEAVDRQRVLSYVDGLGLLPIDVRSKKTPFWKKWLKVSFGRVKKPHLVFFSRQLSTLIKAG
ncbi:type II secretion system F family protein, partial [PVC group bacterium]|nr:type II secretion system F family protein [PVC group bacterium]